MRIKHFFGLAVLAAMTASCSSNNDLVNGGNGSGENESGAAMHLSLSTCQQQEVHVLIILNLSQERLTSTMYLMLLCWFSRRVQLPVKVIILLLRKLIWVQWNHGRTQVKLV